MRKTRPAVIVSPDEMNDRSHTVLSPPTSGGFAAPFRVSCQFAGSHGEIRLDSSPQSSEEEGACAFGAPVGCEVCARNLSAAYPAGDVQVLTSKCRFLNWSNGAVPGRLCLCFAKTAVHLAKGRERMTPSKDESTVIYVPCRVYSSNHGKRLRHFATIGKFKFVDIDLANFQLFLRFHGSGCAVVMAEAAVVTRHFV